ncbi:SigB/SigF/SigG family RNA polymerase sigma factor [Kitasatospora sp. NPDC059327]|uniref:SigB/SigF/SigG family RNA polymerase sigma factor n=1 Tax=Kitasatospora sp. NPDC059327 TaxID=3346803 RepID=UPI0036B984C2
MAPSSDALLAPARPSVPGQARPSAVRPGTATLPAAPGSPAPRGLPGRPAETSETAESAELPDITEPSEVSPADARALTRTLLARLDHLEEGTREYSYVRATLIELNISLVRYAARRFNSSREPQEDLVQAGIVGLIKAIDRFDPRHGVEFTTFAVPTVLGEIRRHFRDTTWAVHVPRRLQELRLTLARAQEQLTQRLDRAPTVAELAAHLSLTPEEVTEGLAAANGHTVGSLDLGSDSPDDARSALADRLGREDGRLEKVENLVSLKPLIAALPARDRLILSMRFTEELTQSEIGARLGVSQMHVSRLLSRILRRLRAALDEG